MEASNLNKPLQGSEEEKGRSPSALPVDLKKEASLLLMDMKNLIRAPPFQAIPFVLVNLWALISACVFGSFSAYDVFLGPNPSDKVLGGDVLLRADGWARRSGKRHDVRGILVQPDPGRRSLFTKAALAATAAIHCMHGRVQILLVAAYPGDVPAIAALLAVLIVLEFDVICFLILKTVEDITVNQQSHAGCNQCAVASLHCIGTVQ